MRVAIAEENGHVSLHFGRTRNYLFVDFEDGKVINKKLVPNPGAVNHTPGQLPAFVAENKADWIVAGGMGPMAVNLFLQNNIKVVTGVQGSTEDVIQRIIDGTLEGGKSLCDHAHMSAEEHEHHHENIHG
ncbi:NifB/NifX family molybdenum-iron cluster-binding protein [Candidatus Harpocratesius sp.]